MTWTETVSPDPAATTRGRYPDMSALHAAFRVSETTAREALEACLERVAALNASVNAIVHLEAAGARRKADRCDLEKRAGRKVGPLHGIPVTVKECFDWAGRPTTWGDPGREEHIADRDSAIVERLRKAGAIIIGKTNIPAYLGDWETSNPLHGTTRNPHDTERSAGGSSGGAAAAVATGMSYADIGSDLGGSIRLPAHYCGVFGLKPTWGLVPMLGHSPRGESREPDIGVAGPITRSARDAAMILQVLSGPADPGSPWGIRLPPADPRPLRDLRIAVILADERCPVDGAYLDRLERFSATLARAGATVEPGARPDVDLARQTEIMNLLVRAETSTRPALSSSRPHGSGRRTGCGNGHAELNARGANLPHRAWLELHEERLLIGREWSRFFREYDLLACPAGVCTAPPLEMVEDVTMRTVPVNGRRRPVLEQHFWFGLASLPGLPAICVPLRRAAGELPAGVQLVSSRYSDLALCGLAEMFHEFEEKDA